MRERYQEALLERHLRTYLGQLEPAAAALLRKHLRWVELAAGATLMAQGEPGDSMYLTVSGRLRAYVRDADGVEHRVREMARGQVIGEMSLYTDQPRSATVVAIRDSVLVRLDRSAFAEILAGSVQLSIALTRQMIERLQSTQTRSNLARPVTIAVLPISAGVDAHGFSARIAAHLRSMGRVCVVDATTLARDLQPPDFSGKASEADESRYTALRLDQIEAEHDVVLLVGDDRPTLWTRRCSRRCDEILLLADATQPPVLHDTERHCLMARAGRAEAAEMLVLLHPEDQHCPRGTREWLDRRPLPDHVHIRPALPRDMARLARILSHSAVGLVLAGGGARGFAHLGIYRALKERGIEVDYVGGTSIGAVMAVLIASDRPLDGVLALARKAFGVNPTGDFNLLPLLSLIKGRRLRSIIEGAVHDLLGFDADVEDLWKRYYCIASNYSKASECRIERGNLAKAVRASIAIPGALPPVILGGDLLCDGGTFNNFPVDVMLDRRGVGPVIGVDLDFRKPRRIEHDEPPSSWQLLRDRLRPRAQRRYKFPSLLSYLMNVNILYSTSRQREAQKLADLYFNPPLERIGILQWEKFDSIVTQGHAHASGVLDALTPDQLSRFRAKTAT